MRFDRFNLGRIVLLAVPTFFIAGADIAAARVDEAPPSAIVRYDDLNLATQEGVVILYERIHAAALSVCKSVEGPQLVNRLFWTEWNNCTNHAVAEAVHAVHNEKLSAYQWERIGGWRHRPAALRRRDRAI